MPPGNVDEEQPLLHRDISEERGDDERQEVKFSEDDEENPKAWNKRKKLTNVAIIALMSILSPLASSMFTPGIKQVAEDLKTDQQSVIATTTGFVIMLGFGPLVIAPLSETFGRRQVYIYCFVVFSLLQIPTALAPNVATLITVRTVSGFFGSKHV
jgi:MFS family permease